MGPFYFAYIEPGDAFNAVTHAVEDEKIVSFSFEHTEAEFGLLTMTIRNPRVGMLAPGRKRWAFLSWDNGSEIVALFKGRIVALPSALNKNLIDVQFIARPSDYAAVKEALAETLRVLPYYDPVFISEDQAADPDVVLEGRTVAWHIDRVTHELTVSDFIEAEDGLATFIEGDVPWDTVEIELDQPPVRRVRVEATVPWDQNVTGDGLVLFKGRVVDTIAGKGLIDGWPAVGDSIGGGWVATASSAKSLYGALTDEEWKNWYTGRDTNLLNRTTPFALELVADFHDTVTNSGGLFNIHDGSTTIFAIVNDRVILDLSLGYEGGRKRTDTVIFDLVADTQSIVTEPDDADAVTLKITGNDVGLPLVAEGNAIPIGDVQRRSYFTQDRGRQSLQYLIQLARANIINRARAVKITFECSFERAVALSLRKSAVLIDNRLPGGQALGKVVAYTFSSVEGKLSGTCTIACSIGYGGVWTESPGEAHYVEDDTVEDDTQGRDGQYIILGANDVTFNPLLEAANDDGLIFPLTSIPLIQEPINVTVETVELAPVQPLTSVKNEADDCGNTTTASIESTLDTGPYSTWLQGVQTTVDFSLKPIDGGPFDAIYFMSVSRLRLPMQIDLEELNS